MKIICDNYNSVNIYLFTFTSLGYFQFSHSPAHNSLPFWKNKMASEIKDVEDSEEWKRRKSEFDYPEAHAHVGDDDHHCDCPPKMSEFVLVTLDHLEKPTKVFLVPAEKISVETRRFIISPWTSDKSLDLWKRLERYPKNGQKLCAPFAPTISTPKQTTSSAHQVWLSTAFVDVSNKVFVTNDKKFNRPKQCSRPKFRQPKNYFVAFYKLRLKVIIHWIFIICLLLVEFLWGYSTNFLPPSAKKQGEQRCRQHLEELQQKLKAQLAARKLRITISAMLSSLIILIIRMTSSSSRWPAWCGGKNSFSCLQIRSLWKFVDWSGIQQWPAAPQRNGKQFFICSSPTIPSTKQDSIRLSTNFTDVCKINCLLIIC